MDFTGWVQIRSQCLDKEQMSRRQLNIVHDDQGSGYFIIEKCTSTYLWYLWSLMTKINLNTLISHVMDQSRLFFIVSLLNIFTI